jgi:hypothetical protein
MTLAGCEEMTGATGDAALGGGEPDPVPPPQATKSPMRTMERTQRTMMRFLLPFLGMPIGCLH